MPAEEALALAAERVGVEVRAEVISSNELLEQRLQAESFDLVFPSDYLVERLAARVGLTELDLPAEIRDGLADWARDAPHDPGCRVSIPFAFGTTGYLCDERLRGGAASWSDLFRPQAGLRVGMLGEVREVIGATLIAVGRSPNDVSPEALTQARRELFAQRPHVLVYGSDDFISPVLRGDVSAHQAWSGPAAAALREHSRLRYFVPAEGAVLWVTTGAIPSDAPEPGLALRLLVELASPELAALTTERNGYATPSEAARERLPSELAGDRTLFPDADIRSSCFTLHDLGESEGAFVRLYEEVATSPVGLC